MDAARAVASKDVLLELVAPNQSPAGWILDGEALVSSIWEREMGLDKKGK
jgi:hypothetical protein